MEKREDTPIEIYNRGKNIMNLLEKYSALISTATDEDKAILKEKLIKLNGAKDKIKDELYEEAKKKSGLDYSKKEKNPELLRKEYNEKLSGLKKRKQDLRLERIRIEKLNEQKKAQIKEQFDMASEKYKQMLDMGKITPEIYEARLQNMARAKAKDGFELDCKLKDINEENEKTTSEITKIQNSLKELEQKEIIYNEYGDIYYRLFGEVLVDRNKMDISKGKSDNGENKKEKTESAENLSKNETKENITNGENAAKANSNVKPNNEQETENSNNSQNNIQSPENNEKDKEIEPNITVTSKTVFDDLYKKLKKGSITEQELNALADTLSNPDNYDKYGITTGLVFNKAKKILKFQGARTAKNIEKFLRDNSGFSADIKFDSSVEKDNILSHDILNSWKDIDKKLTYTDSKFSVEEYIGKIEKYKEDGNQLTKEQEEILKKAVDIKNNLSTYRKAINVNDDVTTTRDKRDRNSIFYVAFKNRQKDKSNRALPERTSRENNPGFIVMGNGGLDLSSMTNREPSPEEARDGRTAGRGRSKDSDIVK